MSLFSRLFRKAPSLSSVSSSAPTSALANPADKVPPKPGAADRALAAAAEDKTLQAAIEANDVQAIARLVVAGTSTKIRQAAAQAIDDAELLRQLIRDVRGGNDKSVYKILTAKRDEQVAQARKQEQLATEINAASAALERHSQRPYDATYGSTLEQLVSRWDDVAPQADAARCELVQQWIAHAREIIAEQASQRAEQMAREQATAAAAAEARQLHEQQAEAAAATAAEQAQVIEEQQRVLAEVQASEQQRVREIAVSIRRARGALNDGGTARAAGLRQAIEAKLADAPALPANVVSQLQQLDQQLDELKEWKSFSVAPKRAELIEAMESLVGATLGPLALSERIKRLQDEWRTLSKGTGENVETDTERFEMARQQANQPCAEYFAAQALVLADNLQRRDALLVRLTAFEAETNGEHADWPAVIKVLREMKQAWRDCAPVDRVASKPQQEKFLALTASLQGRLDAEYARNLQQKESLIERARQALASEDGRKAIDTIKALQQQWRTVGPVPREADQRLWGEFRQHCDAVFQRREQESNTHNAALENNKTQAITLCEQLETMAALEGADLLASASVVSNTRTAFEALGELPRAETRELRSRFDRGLERYEQALARQRLRDAEQAWNDLFEAANHVRAYRLAAARGVDAETRSTLKAVTETHIAKVQRWPKGGLDALQQALADELAADLAANEAMLRMLCIRAEILLDLPTPADDQSLRRELQLQRLVQGMGQRLKADEAPMDSLTIEWVRAGPVDELVYAPLLERFKRCREQRNGRVDGRR